jgi:ATP-dependent helicase/nuclease subunit A
MATLTESQMCAVKAITSNVLVSAGAGSGKTRVLVERVIEILREKPETRISQIVAVTYTRKAAAEMRTRLKQRLQELSSEAAPFEKQLWLKHLSQIDTAKIGTIHSLCETILRTFFLETNMEAEFEQLDDVARAELVAETTQATLRQIISDDAAEHKLLLRFPPEDLSVWVHKILSAPQRFLEATRYFEDLTEAVFAKRLRDLLATVQSRVLRRFIQNRRLSELRQTLKDLADTDAVTNLGTFRQEVLGRLNEIEQALASELNDQRRVESWKNLEAIAQVSIGKRGKTSETTKQLRRVVNEITEIAEDCLGNANSNSLIPAETTSEDLQVWHHTELLISLGRKAIALFDEGKLKHGIDYDDLISRVSAVLADETSSVREHFHRVLTHILVDEFQDTNVVQANLIKSLAGPETRLFLIGDAKQSIYKFQGAEVAHFNHWLSEFKKDSVRNNSTNNNLVVELNESFRSHPQIVDFFNAIFEQLFIGDDMSAPYYASYRSLIPRAKIDDQDSSPRVPRVEVIECSAESQAEVNGLEARSLALWIKNKIATSQASFNSSETNHANGSNQKSETSMRPLGFGDIAVLVQTNDMFNDIEQSLSSADIPYVRFGGRGFLNRQEIYDLENFLNFLHNPENNHALIGLLRAPFCGLPDDLIHRLFANQITSFWTLLKNEALSGDQSRSVVRKCYRLLQRFLDDAPFMPLPSLLRKFIQESNYDLTLLETRNGKQRSRNLWKLVSFAEEHEEMDAGALARRLKIMRELKIKKTDAPVDASNSVKLMTIHAAKGLEFPVVLLPRLASSGSSRQGKLLFHSDYGIAFNDTRTAEDTKPLYHRLANWLEKDMDEAEKQRLLYVAMTRARDYLTIFLPKSKNANSKRSFAAWLSKNIYDNQSGTLPELDGQPETFTIPGIGSKFLFRRIADANKAFDNANLSTTNSIKAQHDCAATEAKDSSSRSSVEAMPCIAPQQAEAKDSSLRWSAERMPCIAPEQTEAKDATSRSSAETMPCNAPHQTDSILCAKVDRSSVETKPQQLSIFGNGEGLVSPNVEEIDDYEGNLKPGFDDALIEPLLIEPREFPNNSLATKRISPSSAAIVVSPILLGDYFHALLERLGPGKKEFDQPLLRNIALSLGSAVAHEQVLASLVSEGKRLLSLYAESELFELIRTARSCYHEMPYSVQNTDRWESKRPDLLLLKPDQSWCVIDYKTDTFLLSNLNTHVSAYRSQLITYASDLANLMGEPFSASLYFAQHGLLVPVNQN